MKLCLGTVALLVAASLHTTDAAAARASTRRIPRSLSKAALEATKRTTKLRKLEQQRVRGLTEMIAKHGSLKPSHLEELKNEQRSNKLSKKDQVLQKSGDAIGTSSLRMSANRELENNYNNYNNANGNYNNANNANGNYNNANNQDANADAQAADGGDNSNMWQYNWNYDGEYDLNENLDNEDVGFDMTAYSFHYTGCSAIKTWSDEMAQDEDTDTVLMAQRMATFRLCPTDQCSSNTYNGCSSNYGDYVVSMDQFLLGMLALQEDRVMGYCEYCQECANIESFKQFYAELDYRREYVIKQSETNYEKWVENYKENYAQAKQNQQNANYYWNYNGNNNGYNQEGQDEAAEDDQDDDYYKQLYYKRLTSGNQANNYVYGGNGYYQNYQNNKYNGGGYQYNNGQQNYDNNFNMYYNNNGGNYNNGNYNGNGGSSYYYNGNNNNQAYGGNYGENNNKYGYQSQNQYGQYSGSSGQYGGYGTGGDDQAAMDDATLRQYQYQMKNAEKWTMWNSFNMHSYGNGNGNNVNGDYQTYQQMYQQMQGWSNMGAWYGHRIVNGKVTYDDNGNAEFEEGWGFIGSDGEFYSLEDTKSAIQGTEFGYQLPEGWDDWLKSAQNGKGADAIESCSYDNAGSCYNQFFACMQVLGQDDYEEYVEQFNNELYEEMYEDADVERFRATMSDYLQCTKIDFDVEWNGNGNDQNNNQNQNDQQNNYQGGGYDYSSGQWQAYDGMDYQGQWEQYRADDGDLEFYIGPHCDGDKITLGVYTDEYCSTYASGILIEDLLGFNPLDEDNDDFDLVPTECVSCAYDEVSLRH